METIEYRQLICLGDAGHTVSVTREAMAIIAGDEVRRSHRDFVARFGGMVVAVAQIMVAEDRVVGRPKHLLSAEWIRRALVACTITERELNELRAMGSAEPIERPQTAEQ